LNEELRQGQVKKPASAWFADCCRKKKEWEAFKANRYARERLFDEVWNEEVLTQPAAIKAAVDWARKHEVVTFFDAGDVQANGMQIVEDDRLGQTFTETGASFMGFAVSALLATGLSNKPFYGLALTGDGSFTMSPQILIDGVEHGAQGCILVLDNRRMAAISGLQLAQYGKDHATNDHVDVDYVAWAKAIKGVAAFHGGRSVAELVRALDQAQAHPGLSLIHLPVYYGPDSLGGLGAFGRWNVGNWCDDVQALRHDIGL
jgi:3D-(3,5/4)-trihydroxycyclohexane-1,2-dione acylhydrolase (decyclizing)